MKADQFIEELWGFAAEVPMGEHPWFDGIIKHRWTREQIILGEVQHYLRVRTNPIFFGYMAVNAVSAKDYRVQRCLIMPSNQGCSPMGTSAAKPHSSSIN